MSNSSKPRRETVLRLLHDPEDNDNNTNGGRVLYSRRGVQCEVKEKDTLIEEMKCKGIVTGVRICALYRPELHFNANTMLYYIGVSKLELCCPSSVDWVFDWASHLPHLKSVRFGKGFFMESEIFPPVLKKIEKSPRVEELVIHFNKAEYDRQDVFTRERSINKLNVILDHAATYFIGLKEVNFTLPDIPALVLFEQNANPAIRSTATKCPISIENMVHYFTVTRNIPWIKRANIVDEEEVVEVPTKKMKPDARSETPPKIELKPELKEVMHVDITGKDEVATIYLVPVNGQTSHKFGEIGGMSQSHFEMTI